MTRSNTFRICVFPVDVANLGLYWVVSVDSMYSTAFHVSVLPLGKINSESIQACDTSGAIVAPMPEIEPKVRDVSGFIVDAAPSISVVPAPTSRVIIWGPDAP